MTNTFLEDLIVEDESSSASEDHFENSLFASVTVSSDQTGLDKGLVIARSKHPCEHKNFQSEI